MDTAPAECPICLDAPAVIETVCHHRFCKSCLQRWMQYRYSCPLCRNQLTSLAPSGSFADYSVCFRIARVRFDADFPRRLRWLAASGSRLRMPWWLTIDGCMLGVWLGRHRLLSRSCRDVANMVNGEADTALNVRLGDTIAAVRWREDAQVSGSVREWFRLASDSA